MLNVTQVPVEGCTLETFTAVATTSSSLLSLTFGNSLGEFLLDDVSVVAVPTTPSVPEPATLPLMALAATGMGWSMKRRRAR